MNKGEEHKKIEEKFKDIEEKTLALESEINQLEDLVTENDDKKARHKFQNISDHFYDMKSCIEDFEQYFSQ